MAEDDLENDWGQVRHSAPDVVEEPVVVIAESIPAPIPQLPRAPQLASRPVPQPTLGEIVMTFLWNLLGYAIVAGIVDISGWAIYASLRADGHVEGCYIERPNSNYIVRGRISWRTNPDMGEFATLDEALIAKKKLCP